ncbi:hypothetical protein [Marinimicrobium agarilyticum]|uniref:hypothetical protein n=1 Tax=Marinimicrobium agarilyticum TaxID=306546 RepID=UPI00048780BF|nr:hypothetical protein [Marinimicrobium agarilyticum]
MTIYFEPTSCGQTRPVLTAVQSQTERAQPGAFGGVRNAQTEERITFQQFREKGVREALQPDDNFKYHHRTLDTQQGDS